MVVIPTRKFSNANRSFPNRQHFKPSLGRTRFLDISGRHYRWFVTIYVREVMQPKDAATLWAKVCRKLREKGVVALWVREPTKKNKVHYHLIVSSQQSKEDLIAAIESAMPDRQAIDWHKNIKPVDYRWWLAYYITKAKIRGKFKGNIVPDKYATKRLLFKSGTGLDKHGTIGNFWLKPTKANWKEVQEQEKKIAEGLEDERVRNLAKHVYKLLDGYYPLRRIERSFGFDAQSSVIQNWFDALAQDEPFSP
jgi:hypothetical protein